MKAIAEAFGCLSALHAKRVLLKRGFIFEPKVTRRRGWNRSEEAIAFAFNPGFSPFKIPITMKKSGVNSDRKNDPST
ncbi:hypothetical protein [Paenibacillus terrae]|uniref:hypothetical protein n=1 Tax=Paenibacillus terrae TaxID=159743 RepID=UPI001BAEB7B6|nr:hypothetical protein [Paenibacillus terrae]